MNKLIVSLLLLFNITNSVMHTSIGRRAFDYSQARINFQKINQEYARREIDQLFREGRGTEIQDLVNRGYENLSIAMIRHETLRNHIMLVRLELGKIKEYVSGKVICAKQKCFHAEQKRIRKTWELTRNRLGIPDGPNNIIAHIARMV